MLSKIKTLKELSLYLGIELKQLKLLDPNQHYMVFQIPKPGSNEKRIIEAPKGVLKHLLDKLADGLQWHYSDNRTSAAQGYIRSTKNDQDKRTIFTNARMHLGKKYLLNIDLDNFFHQITTEKVKGIFSDNQLFPFNTETEEILTTLVCYKKRLPMGSPTSPPLSNFAMINLDNELSLWAQQNQLVFTRFVDDLTFSSNKPITEVDFNTINDILFSHRFNPDPEKIKWFGKNDIKEVTGLIVGKTISVPSEYLIALENEIVKLKEIRHYTNTYPDYQVMEWLQKLENTISGRLAFIKSVYGADNKEYRRLLTLMISGKCDAPLESISWRYSGYEFFT